MRPWEWTACRPSGRASSLMCIPHSSHPCGLGQGIPILSLSQSVTHDLPDRTLCPDHTLRFYEDRTNDPVFRWGRKRLFVSIVEGFEREISLATVARWIVSTIQLAYSLMNTSPTSEAKRRSLPMRCMHCLPPGQLITASPSGTFSKQRRGVITPCSLRSTCATVPFWPTACVQSVQSSQSSTSCERDRRDPPF
jgi:hypothetical protein